MNDVLVTALFIGGVVGGIIAAFHLYMLPHRVFLRDQQWLSEDEFRAAFPAKAWCRYVPAISICFGFATHVIVFLTVMRTCTNTLPLMLGFLPLYILWIQVPVGLVELVASISVFVPFGADVGLGLAISRIRVPSAQGLSG